MLRWSLALSGVAILAGGCFLPDLDLTDRACPCSDGYTCDDATQKCVPTASGTANGGGTTTSSTADTTSATGGGGAGNGGSGGGTLCGNGTVDRGEDCDPPDGAACSPTCQTLSEDCSNGVDDDGDDQIDCDDPDCASTCVITCANAPTLGPMNDGTNLGGTTAFEGSCVGQAANSETIYTYTAASTGALVLDLYSETDLGIYVRKNCNLPSTELGCRDDDGDFADEWLAIPMLAGDTVAVFVDTFEPADAGAFSLTANLETLDESEDNDTPANADVDSDGFTGIIDPVGDQDVLTVDVPGPSSKLTVTTFPTIAGPCTFDSDITVLAPDGTTSLGYNDDNGTDGCSLLTLSGLAAGTYFIRVGSSVSAPLDQATFAYAVGITIQ